MDAGKLAEKIAEIAADAAGEKFGKAQSFSNGIRLADIRDGNSRERLREHFEIGVSSKATLTCFLLGIIFMAAALVKLTPALADMAIHGTAPDKTELEIWLSMAVIALLVCIAGLVIKKLPRLTGDGAVLRYRGREYAAFEISELRFIGGGTIQLFDIGGERIITLHDDYASIEQIVLWAKEYNVSITDEQVLK